MEIQNDERSKPGEPIAHSQDVPATREEVWQIISRPGSLIDYHPFCQSNPVEIWPGEGSRDRIYYYSGIVLRRDFKTWIDGVGYDLIASSEDGMRFKVIWRITTGENDHSCLNLTIIPFLMQDSERRMKQYSRLLGRYLEQVSRGFEFYVRTGERVQRNQFGSHRLFSPPVPKEGRS